MKLQISRGSSDCSSGCRAAAVAGQQQLLDDKNRRAQHLGGCAAAAAAGCYAAAGMCSTSSSPAAAAVVAVRFPVSHPYAASSRQQLCAQAAWAAYLRYGCLSVHAWRRGRCSHAAAPPCSNSYSSRSRCCLQTTSAGSGPAAAGGSQQAASMLSQAQQQQRLQHAPRVRCSWQTDHAHQEQCPRAISNSSSGLFLWTPGCCSSCLCKIA